MNSKNLKGNLLDQCIQLGYKEIDNLLEKFQFAISALGGEGASPKASELEDERDNQVAKLKETIRALQDMRRDSERGQGND